MPRRRRFSPVLDRTSPGRPARLTGGRLAAERSQAVERQLWAILDKLPAGVLVIDADGCFHFANQRAAASFGLTPAELIGKSLSDLFPPEIARRYLERNRAFIAARGVAEYEVTFDLPVGTRTFFVSDQVLTDTQDNGAFLLSSAIDITAHKATEADLQIALTKYRTLFDSFPLGITVADATGRIVEANRMAESLLGLRAEEHCQRSIDSAEWQIIRPDGSPMPAAEYASVRALHEQRVVANVEMGVRTAHGTTTWLNVTAAPLPLDDGGVVITYGDITARRATEAALRESERSLQYFLDNSPDTIYLLDLVTHTSRFLNRNTFLGYSRHELERDGSILGAVHPDDQATVVTQWQQLTTLEERGLPPIHYRVRRRRGDWEWLQQRVTVLSRTEQGTPHKVLITLCVITAQRQAEDLVATQRDLARMIAATTDPVAVLPRCLDLAIRVTGMDSGGLYLFDADAQALNLVCHYGLDAAFIQKTTSYAPDTPNAQLVRAGTAAYLSVAETLRIEPFQHEGLTCIAIMPIGQHGTVLGCVNLGSHILPDVPAFARHALETIAPEIGNVIAALRTTATLREREEFYRSLIDSQESVIATLDADGVFHYTNQIGTAIVGRRLTDLAPPQIAARQLQQIQQVLASGQGIVVEEQIPIAGTLRWSRTSIQPIRDAAGTPVLAMVNALDITERKQAEERLRALNQTLEARVAERTAEVHDLYDQAPVGYHSLDREGRIVHVNQTELDWLGYTREELIGCPPTVYLTPASQAIFQVRFPQFQASGEIDSLELELQRKDGSTFPALVQATAVYDDTGAFVMSRSTLVDITARKQVDVALRESEEQLRLSEARLHLLLDKTPAVIFSSLAEPDFRSTFISESVRAVLGYEPAQFLDHPGFWANRIHPEDKPRVFGDAPQFLAQGWRQYEYRCCHADGSYRWVESGVSLLPATAGHPAEVVGYMIDITPRKQAEALLRQANAELARAARDKDAFLANMSHELRTPLNAIFGFGEILRAEIRGPLNAGQQEALQSIETSGRHLLALISDILDLAKGEAGRLTLQPERVQIADVCEASLLFVKEQALKNGVRLDVQIAAPDAMIEADPRRLKQMLVNLLTNAVKFTPRGGLVMLAVAIDVGAGLVHFRVEDTGIGIAPEDLSRLFQPFSQLDSTLSRQQAGTGLGLALVRRLAELHGGEVQVESTVGVGSCFTITLPTAQPALVARKPTLGSPGTPPGAPGAPGAPRPRVLVADDNEDNLLMVAEYLEANGYAVALARSGQEALAQVAVVRPAVILMDIQMLDLDGLEVIRRLRAQAAWASTPILALTALAMPGDRERCLEAGADDFLTKPVQLQRLVATIEALQGARG